MRRTPLYLLTGLMITAGPLLSAQEYSVGWHVIPGGGGTSSGGQYSLSGSIGQAAVGETTSGESYSLTGGFWSLVSVVQTLGAPVLAISRAGSQLIISWPTPSANWTLQQNSNLADAGGWVTSGYAVSTNNGISSITVSSPTGNLFFRLSPP